MWGEAGLPSWPWHHVLKGLALLPANGPSTLWEPAGHRYPRADFCLTGMCSWLGHAVSLHSFAARFQIEKCKPQHTHSVALFWIFGYLGNNPVLCPFFLQENGESKRHVALLGWLSWSLSVPGPARPQGTKARAWGPGQGLWGQEPLWGLPPQLWARGTEAKGTAGRRPHCPPWIQPCSQAWGALGSGLASGATQAGLSAHLPLGGTLDLQCPLLPARVDPRLIPLTQN